MYPPVANTFVHIYIDACAPMHTSHRAHASQITGAANKSSILPLYVRVYAYININVNTNIDTIVHADVKGCTHCTYTCHRARTPSYYRNS